MKRKAVSGVMLTLLLTSILTFAFNIQTAKASGTIYIRADGSIEGTTHISSADNITYTFTGNISDSIVVERSNIIVDGEGYTLQGAGGGKGFFWSGIKNVTIQNTNIKNFDYGIYLYYSDNNSISGNNITANNAGGVDLDDSSNNNSISGNNIANNEIGIRLDDSSNNNSISGNNIANNERGIRLDESSNNSISRNNIANNWCGVDLAFSSNNSISGNNITANNGFGIQLFYSSNNNSISGNNIANNLEGIRLYHSSNNSISGNNIANNGDAYMHAGITLYYSSNNRIYHNNFIDNTQQVYSYSSTNVWDDGYPSGGNYWSDYIAKGGDDTDGDGIGDTPYAIDANNRDRYPLMEPWSIPTMIKSFIRTVVFCNLPQGTENSLTPKLDGAIHLLNKGNENGAIHKLMDFISQVEASRGKKLNNEQADQLISEAQRIIDLIEG